MGKQNGLANAEVKDALIVGQTNQGAEIRATLLRMTRFTAVFEIYTSTVALRTSEVLNQFKIIFQDRTIYSGSVVVASLVNMGPMTICEVTLNESCWRDIEFSPEMLGGGKLSAEFNEFMRQWERLYKVMPEFKVIVADLQTFLNSLRLWVDQIELGIRSSPFGDRLQSERQFAEEIGSAVFPYLDNLFGKIESVASHIDPELRAVHCAYVKRQIHSLLLSAPFAFRAVSKPLGYAGDYEMVNMILRDPHEGASLYAKILNRWFIRQPPAEAHRNRITYLTEKLLQETVRVSRYGKPIRVFNLGCGPAKEVQNFMSQHAISDQAALTLVDFNEETLAHAKSVLASVRTDNRRNTQIQFAKKSVAHMLKGKDRTGDSQDNQYDFVYCAGLFDYLSDAVCKQMMGIFYNMLAPGGLLVTTNVDCSNPIQHWLGDVLEWPLIYRDSRQMLSLVPEASGSDNVRISADITGVNLFLEVRKPA